MRKWFMLVVSALLLGLVACGDSGDTDEASNNNTTGENNEQKLRVAVVESPMSDVVEIAQEILAEDNIEVEIVVMGDYIQPNEALANKEVDAHFTMHFPMMNQFNEKSNYNLVEVQPIYYPNFGLYAKDYASLEEIPEDATIGIANDPANLDRSLRMLAAHNLIELNEIDGNEHTLKDVKEGSHNYDFKEAGLAALPRLYEDVDGIILNPTHAGNIDLTPNDDAIIREDKDNEFAVILAAREDNADSELIQKLAEAMMSEEVRDFLNSRKGGAAVPAF